MSWRRRESGAAAVETALCICFIVLPLTLGIISYGYMLSVRQTLSQAAAEGARAAAVLYTTDTGTTKTTDQTTAAQNAVTSAMSTIGLSCSSGSLVRTSDSKVVGTCAVATLTAGATGCTGSTNNCVQVSINYSYRSYGPATFPGVSILVPSHLAYSATAETS